MLCESNEFVKNMDAPDENVNNNTPGSNAQAGGNTIETNNMANVPAAASGAAGAANNAAVMDPTRALMARRQNKLIGALHSCGITLLVTADKFITKQGLDLVQSLMQLSKKHIKEMFNYHNQPLKTNMLRATGWAYACLQGPGTCILCLSV